MSFDDLAKLAQETAGVSVSATVQEAAEKGADALTGLATREVSSTALAGLEAIQSAVAGAASGIMDSLEPDKTKTPNSFDQFADLMNGQSGEDLTIARQIAEAELSADQKLQLETERLTHEGQVEQGISELMQQIDARAIEIRNKAEADAWNATSEDERIDLLIFRGQPGGSEAETAFARAIEDNLNTQLRTK